VFIFQTNKFPLENKYYLTITCFHVPYSLKSWLSRHTSFVILTSQNSRYPME